MRNKIIYVIIIIILVIGGMYLCYRNGYNKGYEKGYEVGYNTGYDNGYKDRNALVSKEIADAVQMHSKTETKVVYKEIPYNGNDVQIRTEKPVVTVEVNGKKQEVEQKTATADLAVKTESNIKIKVPERKWTFGIGTDGHKATYMLKAPIKNAVGVWVAGGGKDNRVMGGVSISF